ncbi:DUF1616 domain-containing protein [Candidatus Lokiarchaeum ossiferum]|uniref:DUF1616 domain-containing protein n=1 Tax=Candidatus Lokiarchaeum ossiferum TaxID=2951803 RepID=UPI00352DD485
MSEDPEWKDGLSLNKITRIVLLVGIIVVSGAMVYTLTRPEEEDVLFFILNEDQVMKDYPVNASVNQNVSVHAFVENHLQRSAEFAVRVYRGNSNLTHNISIGVEHNSYATYLFNYTKILENEVSWITPKINVSFPIAGPDQQVILELWVNTDFGWRFLPEYITFLRIEVY